METCRRLSHIARVSGWKHKNSYRLLTESQTKAKFGCPTASSASVALQAEDVPYPLTKEEAFIFLDKSLGISQSQVDAAGKSLELLNHIVQGIKKAAPFTNMNLLAGKFPDLSPQDMKHHVTSGQGGTCLWINPFTKVLLEQLGHRTYHISGEIPVKDVRMEYAHVSTIVCDLSFSGSRHLVDPGVRWPLNEAVSLDFTSESPEYTFHKLRTKFFKRDNETLLLCTPSSPTSPEKHVICDSNGQNWQVRIAYLLNDKIQWSKMVRKFQLIAKTITTWEEPFDSLLFFASSNLKHVSIVCSDGKARATFVNLEDQSTKRVAMTKIGLMDFFLENYPQYSVKKLEKVFEVSKLI